MKAITRLWAFLWIVLLTGTFSTRADLIGFYPFDEATTPPEDESGLNNTLVSAGANPAYEAEGGLSGGAYRFSGAERWIVPIDINPSTYGHLTMGAWVRTTSLAPGLRKIMGHDDGGWDRTIGLDTRFADGAANGPFRFTSFTGSGPGPNELPGPTSTEDWALVVAVYDDLTPQLTVYVDADANTVGDDVVSVTVPDALFGFGHPTASIGNLRPDNSNESWIGYIDNAFFYDQLLTSEEVTAIRNKGTPLLDVQANPNFSALSVPDLSSLAKATATHPIEIPIRNDGSSASLNISSVTVTGRDAEFYTVGAFPAQLAAGATGSIQVSFAHAGQVGNFAAVLNVVSDDSVQPRSTLDLGATVVGDGTTDPAATIVTPAPIFGEVGSTPTTRTLEVRNAGAAQMLAITDVIVVGTDAARYTVNEFPRNLPPGATGPIRVTFDPAGETKSFSARLEVYSNDASNRVTSVDLAATVRTTNIRSALVGFYSFDDAANPRKDDSGNGNDLTDPEDGSVPTHDPQAGREGGAFVFDGSTRLIVPININPTAIPELTLGAWVRTDMIEPGLRKIMGHDNGGWDRTIGLDNRVPDDAFRYTAFSGDSPGPVDLPGPENTEDWTFIAASFNQTLGQMAVYVDLNSETTDDAPVSATRNATFGPGFPTFAIGGIRPDSGAEAWVGSIDNVFVYEVVLNAEQVAQVRTGGKAFILADGPAAAPNITSVTSTAAGVTLVWTSTANASYSVQYSENLPPTWTPIATQASQGNSTSYQDTDATRLGRPRGFYRIAVQP